MIAVPHRVHVAGLREERRAAGLRQSDLAQCLGCTPAYVSRVERGEATISPAEFEKLRLLLSGQVEVP